MKLNYTHLKQIQTSSIIPQKKFLHTHENSTQTTMIFDLIRIHISAMDVLKHLQQMALVLNSGQEC